MKPAPYNLTIYQRATFRQRLRLLVNSGQPALALGYSVAAQFWDDKRRTLFAAFDVEIVDLATSTIELVIPFEVTRQLRKGGKWDLLVTTPYGDRQYWVEGNVTVDPGYTDIEA